MIVHEKTETYDGSHRILRYEAGEDGALREQAAVSDLDDQIETYYSQRKLEMERLKGQVLAGTISPIALCMTYQQMTLPDLATRAGLSKRQVKRHLTAEGFRAVTVEQLGRYARVFDVAVADFFQFLLVKEGAELKEERRRERLIQLIEVAAAASEGER